MNERSHFLVRRARWALDAPALRRIREAVFVTEQKVPLALEWDDRDPDAEHFLAEDEEGNPIGTARLLTDGQIGRMAVLKSWRHQGVGSALLRAVLDRADQPGRPRPFLNAQLSAKRFYEKHGFRTRGEPFTEAGIPHQRMEPTDNE